jgi:hypothetical protein
MSTAVPKLSSAKVTFAILCAVAFLFVGCVQISTEGRAFDLRHGELSGLLYMVAGSWLAFWLYRIAFKSKPSFTLHEDRIEHCHWKQPIFFRDVAEVVLEPAQFLGRRHTIFYLRLADNSIQHIPFGLMTHGPAEFADLLNKAVEHYRATHSTAS